MSGAPDTAQKNTPLVPVEWCASFPLIRKTLPLALVNAQQAATLEAFVKDLPGVWAWSMFETRLTDSAQQIDVLSCALGRPLSKRKLAAALDSARHPAWPAAAALLRPWILAREGELARIPTVWFEWDQDRAVERPPLAWACIDPHFFQAPRSAVTPAAVEELVNSFYADSASHRLPPIGRLVASLPEGGRLLSMADLSPRGLDAFRVFVELPRHGIPSWLRSIGWSGDLAWSEAYGHVSNPAGEPAFCQIEISADGAVGTYLAVELRQTLRAYPERESRAAWLEHVVAAGLATGQRARAVLDWPGEDDVELPSGRPAKLCRSFHVKVAGYSPSQLVAKAYLGFCFREAAV